MYVSVSCTRPTRHSNWMPAPTPCRRSRGSGMAEPLLRCDQLTMRFGGLVAISGLDLAVAEHSIHSVIGPNGAGKTTVFNCITQNLHPSAGEVWFAGGRIDGLTPDRVAAVGISR